MTTINQTEITFEVKGKPHGFTFYHDLPDTPGMSMDDAVASWLERTRSYSAISFCRYIQSKHTGFFCITQKQYEKFLKQAIEEDENQRTAI